MRQESLTGFVLHARAYKEKSQLVYFFSKEHGVVHGIGRAKQGQFQHLQTYASGKGGLKRFTAFEHIGMLSPLCGQPLYAALYLNELFMRLLAPEEVLHHSYIAYTGAIHQLSALSATIAEPVDILQSIKVVLRTVEYNLLGELGFGVDFRLDSQGQPIQANAQYVFEVVRGFTLCAGTTSQKVITGKQLLSFDPAHICQADCMWLCVVFKRSIDHALDYKPLQSRQIWQSLYHS